MHRGPPAPPAVAFEVVGIVRDVRNAPLGQQVEPALYFTNRQFPFRELFLTVRATDRRAAVSAVTAALAHVAPKVPFSATRTWGEIRAAQTAEPRLLMSVLVFFGGLAALLAGLGVYGLFSWSVALRTRELAIRLVLGARPRSVGGIVLRHGATLVPAGVTAGLILVRLAETALARVLFDVSPGDVASMASASLVLLLAALVACLPPALRAMRVDPQEGLRIE